MLWMRKRIILSVVASTKVYVCVFECASSWAENASVLALSTHTRWFACLQGWKNGKWKNCGYFLLQEANL
jgi:hypothetical protein